VSVQRTWARRAKGSVQPDGGRCADEDGFCLLSRAGHDVRRRQGSPNVTSRSRVMEFLKLEAWRRRSVPGPRSDQNEVSRMYAPESARIVRRDHVRLPRARGPPLCLAV